MDEKKKKPRASKAGDAFIKSLARVRSAILELEKAAAKLSAETAGHRPASSGGKQRKRPRKSR